MKKLLVVLLCLIPLHVGAITISTGSQLNLAAGTQIGINNSPTVNLAAGTQINIDSDQAGAFGEVLTSELTPVFQTNFVHGLRTEWWNSTTTNVLSVATVTRSMIQLQTGATANSQYHLISSIPIKHSAGQGGLFRGTAMVIGATLNSDVEWGLGDERDGIGFSVSDGIFGVTRRIASVNHFVSQNGFSEDKLNGIGSSKFAIDITKLNVYEVKYQYLGAGQINFSVENPNTGKFILVHRIKYTNQNTNPSIEEPTLPIHFDVENNGNTSNVSLFSASVMGAIEGRFVELGVSNAISKTKSVTTEAVVFSIRNNSTFNGAHNKSRIKINHIAMASDGAKSVVFNVYRNTVIGGSPVWQQVSTTNSLISFDVAGTLTSGRLIASDALAKVDSDHLDSSDMEIYVNPGEILTVTAQSAAANDVNVSISWKELF